MQDHQEDMDDKQWAAITIYVRSLDKIIYANEARRLLQEKTDMINAQSAAMANAPATGANTSTPQNGAGSMMSYNSNSIQQ
jgi:hypothetical protein